jgi:hypothetical protein
MNSSEPKINVLPNPPLPTVTVADRVASLERSLDPNDPIFSPHHQQNIKALIEMYKDGTTDLDTELYLADGKVVSEEEAWKIMKTVFVWHEVCTHRLILESLRVT